jgi:hypothetical protein
MNPATAMYLADRRVPVIQKTFKIAAPLRQFRTWDTVSRLQVCRHISRPRTHRQEMSGMRSYRPEPNHACEQPVANSSRSSQRDCGRPATNFKRMGDLQYAYYCDEHGAAAGAIAITSWRKIRHRAEHVHEREPEA